MVKIERTGIFEEKLTFFSEDKELARKIALHISLFRKNPSDTRLHNHKLKKVMKRKFAFSITDDIRIVYEWVGKTTVRFITIGSHKEVYSKSS